MKDNEIKEAKLSSLVPVVQAPELIKVRTISPKVVEQLPWVTLDNNWHGQEIIGRLPQAGVIVLRHTSGQLSRASDMVYMETRAKQLIEQGQDRATSIDQANAEIAALRQLFMI